jgi:TetR/AcrR family transcriptional regulator, transcriptional repressor for nem operon
MGRTKEFKVEDALEKALNVFWEKGYEAASISDLTEGMGIQRASLYDTFGSKAELFEQSLIDYQRKGLTGLEHALSQGSDPLDSLRQILYTAIPDEISNKNGCFCVNASVEVAPSNPEIATLLGAHNTRVTERLARVVAAGQAQGQFPIKLSPIEAGAYVLTCLNGLHVIAKTNRNPNDLKNCVEMMLRALTA